MKCALLNGKSSPYISIFTIYIGIREASRLSSSCSAQNVRTVNVFPFTHAYARRSYIHMWRHSMCRHICTRTLGIFNLLSQFCIIAFIRYFIYIESYVLNFYACQNIFSLHVRFVPMLFSHLGGCTQARIECICLCFCSDCCLLPLRGTILSIVFQFDSKFSHRMQKVWDVWMNGIYIYEYNKWMSTKLVAMAEGVFPTYCSTLTTSSSFLTYALHIHYTHTHIHSWALITFVQSWKVTIPTPFHPSLTEAHGLNLVQSAGNSTRTCNWIDIVVTPIDTSRLGPGPTIR